MDNFPRECLILLLGSLLFVGGCAQATHEETTPDVEQVTERLLELENQLNLGVDSLQCGLELVADGKPTFVSNGFVIQTAEELREMCVGLVEPRTGATWNNDFRTVHVLSNNAAYVVRKGTYTINFSDRDTQVVDPVITTIWHLVDGQWKMVHLHESSVEIF